MTRGWANCLLYLFDQLILCLEHKSLSSFFIPQCNLLEGIKRTSIFRRIVERVRSKPLKYAMEFLTSMETFELSRCNDYITAIYLDILDKSSIQSAYRTSNTNECHCNTSRRDIEEHERIANTFYKNERQFLRTFFQNLDSARAVTKFRFADMFEGKPCSYLASFANWCKENKDRRIPLFEEFTLFDVIILNSVHGLSIPYNIMVDLAERVFPTRVWPGKTSNFQESRRLVIYSRTHLILYSMHVGE